jgi:hypothetical protein
MTRAKESLITIDGRSFAKGYTLSDTESVDLTPATVATGAAEIQAVAHEDDVELRLVKQDAQGNDQQTVVLDTLNGNSIDQQNEIRVSEQSNTLFRLKNVSGGQADYIVTGEAVAP